MGLLFPNNPNTVTMPGNNASTPGLINQTTSNNGLINMSNPGLPTGFAVSNTPTSTAQPTAYDPYVDTAAAQAAAQNQRNMDFVNQGFGSKIAGLQDQLNVLDPQRQAGELNLQRQYQTKLNDLNTSHSQGLRNLNMADQKIQAGRVKGLADLADQARQMHMSYNNQLGAYGAGDSSAAQLINQSIAGLSSKNRGNLLQNASDQATQVGMQRQDLETAFGQQQRDLDNWKQSSLTDLYNKYADEKAQIQEAMKTADAQRLQQLAQYDAAYTQQALDSLNQIQSMHTQHSNELIGRYQNMFAPKEISIAPNLQQYAVKPIDAGQISALSMPTAVNPETQAQIALRKRIEEQGGINDPAQFDTPQF